MIETINKINFTSREIDVIACISNGRGVKKIASLLYLSPRTVETHIRNITLKIGCNSKEGIVDFVERTKELDAVKQHYTNLLTQLSFMHKLRDIKVQVQEKGLDCVVNLILVQSFRCSNLLSRLKKDLSLAGIQIFENKLSKTRGPQAGKTAKFVYIFDKTSVQELPILQILQQEREYPGTTFFLDLAIESQALIPSNLRNIPVVSFHSYHYSSTLKLVAHLLPNVDLKNALAEFENLKDGPANNTSATISGIQSTNFHWFQIKKSLNLTLSGIGLLGVSILCLWFYWYPWKNHNSSSFESVIRTDLPIPHQENLLERTKILKNLASILDGSDGIKTAVLAGIGGSGKTILARQYARQQSNKIIWELNGESKASLIDSFETLAYSFALNSENMNAFKSIQEIKNSKDKERYLLFFIKKRLRQEGGWLLIFDNIETFNQIKDYFPHDEKVWGAGRVIITTKDGNIKHNSLFSSRSCIHLGELNEEEKVLLFNKNLKKESLQRNANLTVRNFLKEIPSFPLDISIAAHFIRETNIKYQTYIDYIKTHQEKLPKIFSDITKENMDYNKTRYSIIALSVEKILKLNPRYNLHLLMISLLDSQEIPEDLLVNFDKKIDIHKFLHTLRSYSLISEQHLFGPKENYKTFSMHRSLQNVLHHYLYNLMNCKNDTSKITLILSEITNYMRKVREKYDLPMMKLLAIHCEKYLDKNSNIENLEKKNSLMLELGIFYFYFGKYDKAQELMEKSYSYFKENPKINRVQLAYCSIELGCLYRSIGKYQQAVLLLQQGVEYYKKIYGADHVETAWSLVMLSYINNSLGLHERIIKDLNMSLEIYCKNYPQNHPKIAWVQAHLATAYIKLGQYQRAKKLLENSLEIAQKHFGSNHEQVAWITTYLAHTYKNLGDLTTSRKFLEKCYQFYQNNYGKNHLRTAWVSMFLGELYYDLKFYNRAEQFLLKSLDLYIKHYGPKDPRTAKIQMKLGLVYAAQGQYNQAKTLTEKGYQTYQNHYGSAPGIDKAKASLFLGEVYYLMGKIKQAKQFIRYALQVFQTKNHPFSKKAQEILQKIAMKKEAAE